MTDTKTQIYIAAKPAPKMAELIFIIIMTGLGKVSFMSGAGGLASKRVQDPLDGHVFGLGCICLLRQFPEAVGDGVLTYLAQYARSFAADASAKSNANVDLPLETLNVVHFMELYVSERQETRASLAKKLPMSLIDFVPRTANT